MLYSSFADTHFIKNIFSLQLKLYFKNYTALIVKYYIKTQLIYGDSLYTFTHSIRIIGILSLQDGIAFAEPLNMPNPSAQIQSAKFVFKFE